METQDPVEQAKYHLIDVHGIVVRESEGGKLYIEVLPQRTGILLTHQQWELIRIVANDIVTK